MATKSTRYEKRPFLQWFVITLAYVVCTYFALQFNILQTMWHTDVTYMTSVIAAWFVATCLFLGYATWRYDPKKSNVAYADVGLGKTSAFLATLLGLLGTAIGLSIQVKTMGHVDLSNPANIVGFIGKISESLGSALYATISGIVAAYGITLLTTNLEYFADIDDGSSVPPEQEPMD